MQALRAVAFPMTRLARTAACVGGGRGRQVSEGAKSSMCRMRQLLRGRCRRDQMRKLLEVALYCMFATKPDAKKSSGYVKWLMG